MPVKKLEWWGTGMVICLERDAELHMAQLMPLPLTFSCFIKIQVGFTFLLVAHPGSPGKKSLNGRVCMCVHEEMTFKTVNYVTLHPSMCVFGVLTACVDSVGDQYACCCMHQLLEALDDT